MFVLKNLFQETDSPSAYSAAFLRHMAEMLGRMDAEAIGRAVSTIDEVHANGGTIYVLANGGSAAVASHFVNDLGVNALVPDRPGYHVISLTDNVEAFSAVANDAGFENVFLYQLRCGLRAGDLVLAMSVSGNSENVIRAVSYAKDTGARTIGFCGFEGGRLAETADQIVHIPSSKDEYGPVEDAFSVICHIISGYLTMRRGRFLHH